MHTTKINHTTFHHHGDYSGDVTIVDSDTNAFLEVPVDDLKGFIAEIIRSERISSLEHESVDALLGLSYCTGNKWR